MSLKFAVEQATGRAKDFETGPLSTKLTQYASLLAAQGALSAAATYLGGGGQATDESISTLKERLNGALGYRLVEQDFFS